MFDRSLLRFVIISLALSPVWGGGQIWDELTLSFGLAQQDFRAFRLDVNHNPDFIAQHYSGTSPTFQLTGDKEFTPGWHTQWSLDLHYDLNLDSEVSVNNGRANFDAHSWSAECKSLILFDTDRARGIKIGAGFSVHNYAIMTSIGDNPEYDNTPLAGLIVHFEKDYSLLGLSGNFSIEASKLEADLIYNELPFHYNWYRYSLGNVIWLKRTQDVDQGIRIEYVYWNFDLGRIRNRSWARDFHGMSWCFEFQFK